MSTTKLVICTLVSTIYVFALDYVWYGILTHEEGEAMPNSFVWIIVGTLIFSFFFSLMYGKGVEGYSRTQQGLRYGVMIAFLVFVSMSFVWHGVDPVEMTMNDVLKDSAFRIVQLGILGVIIGHLSGLPHAGTGFRRESDDRGSDTGTRKEPAPPPPEPEEPSGN